MNGVSKITDKITQDAKAWADSQLAEAREEAAAISAKYAAEADQAAEKILAEARQRVQAVDERAKSQADMERRKQILETKQEAVGKAFAQALDSLCGMSDEERTLLMVRMALNYQTGDAEFIFNGADQAVVGPAVVSTVNAIYTKATIKEMFSGGFLEKVKKLVQAQPIQYSATLSKKVGSFSGGFILKQGDIEHNCTFEVLVGAVREELEGEVSSLLFQ